MHLPFIQVANEAIDLVATEVAVALEADEFAVLGGLVRLYRWALQRCPDNLPPSASAVVTGPHAAKLIAKAAGYKGDPETYVWACEAASLPAVERVENGIRIRGLDRYDAAWGKSHPELWKQWKQSRAETGPKPGGSGTEPKPQKQKQKQKEEKEEAGSTAADAAPPSPEALQELWNATADPSLPRWREMPKERREAARRALKARPIEGDTGWRAVFQALSGIPFCLGMNDRGWKASPDWVLKPKSAAKVLEGAYQNGPGPPSRGQDSIKSRIEAHSGMSTKGPEPNPEPYVSQSGTCAVCGSMGVAGQEREGQFVCFRFGCEREFEMRQENQREMEVGA